MSLRMSACGVVCSECGAYVAGQSSDPAVKERFTKAWRDLYKIDVAPEAMVCSGCQSLDGPVFAVCKDCWVRQCAMSKGIAHCGVCDQFPCAELERVQAQYDNLDRMAASMSEEDFAAFVLPYCHVRERLSSAVRRPWDWS
jgi:hypothetical protein